ncbi:spore coat protein U domain-containing protein [Neisseria sp. 83E34]|uniref:Csu type fimbrial protein n=1 Tax=Neisseria sp. 83E34 TaxID=1692264 RepID=UPI0006CE7A5E|nr:spore coat protein U domain-containing protein [Neisseria sp. 83E34]
MKAVKKLFVLTSTMAALSASGMAYAESVSSEFHVTIRIMPVCQVETSTGNAPTQELTTPSAGADIDFGEHLSNSTADVKRLSKAGAGGGIQVKCTKGTPYQIALTPDSTSSTTGAGTMSGLVGSAAATANDKIAYTLYKDDGYSQAWGNQKNVNTLTGSGEGIASPIHHLVYGKVAGAELDKTAGRYIDRVAVEVSY